MKIPYTVIKTCHSQKNLKKKSTFWDFSGGSVVKTASISGCRSPIPGQGTKIMRTKIPLQSKGLSRVFSNTTVQKHQFFNAQLSSQFNSHIHTWLLKKTIALTRRTFVRKVMFLFFNMLSRLVITFLPRSKRLLVSWLQSPSAVILEPPNIKSDTISPTICHEVMDQMPWSSFSECWALSQLFHFSLSLSSRGFLVPLHFLP